MNKEEDYVTPKPTAVSTKPKFKFPIDLSIKLNKPYYYPKEELLGFLKLTVKEENMLLSGIAINLIQLYTVSLHDKQTVKHFQELQPVFGIVLQEYLSKNKTLPQGIHLLPFRFKIPSTFQPAFYYKHHNNILCIKTFMLFSFIDVNKKQEYNYSHELLIIKNTLINYKPQLVSNLEQEQQRLKIIVNVSSDSHMYSIKDFINLKVEIVNNRQTTKVEYIKFSLYMKVTFNDKVINEEKILSKTINHECLPGQSSSFYEQILFEPYYNESNKTSIFQMKSQKDLAFMNKIRNNEGYYDINKIKSINNLEDDPFLEQYMNLPPSVNSKHIQCVYYIKTTVYLKHKILGANASNRPRVFLYFKNIG